MRELVSALLETAFIVRHLLITEALLGRLVAAPVRTAALAVVNSLNVSSLGAVSSEGELKRLGLPVIEVLLS